MAKKKIKDITEKKELPEKELEKVKGGLAPSVSTVKAIDKPASGEGSPWCICSTKCGLPGWVFGSASRDVSC